ncbi:MAG: hypothetical protein AAF631_09060, partial [Pseudomonadota bacterium]
MSQPVVEPNSTMTAVPDQAVAKRPCADVVANFPGRNQVVSPTTEPQMYRAGRGMVILHDVHVKVLHDRFGPKTHADASGPIFVDNL